MGKRRDEAMALFDAFEDELTEVASAGGRDVRLDKQWRLGALDEAKRRRISVQAFIDERRPVLIEAIRGLNHVSKSMLHPEGEAVPFAIFGKPPPSTLN
jgi:hypothetical protein